MIPHRRILLADDHAIVRRGLSEILEETDDMRAAGEAASAHEVLERVRAEAWDALVLDLSLPGRGGLELLADVKRERPALPVLILTIHAETHFAVRALKAGASGYLTKDAAPRTLVEALRKVVAGGRYVGPEVAEALANALVVGDRAPHEALSDREFDVLRRLASGQTVGQIAESLALSVKTVSTYRTRILQKTGMKTNAQLTAYAVRNGLVA